MPDSDRLEVLRDSGSSLYGSNPIAGVVNVLTDEGANVPDWASSSMVWLSRADPEPRLSIDVVAERSVRFSATPELEPKLQRVRVSNAWSSRRG